MRAATDFKATAALLALALAIGGAGVNYPLIQAFLILAALAVATWFLIRPWPPARTQLAKPVLILLTASLLLPLLQLVPLPPAIWQLLPGREQAADLDQLVGWSIWRPWSLDIEATVRTVLVLIPAAVILLGCLRLGSRDRLRLLWIALAFALLSAVLGIVQAASGGQLTPFPSAHTGHPIGLFVNRNHQAVLLLALMPVAAALGAMRMSTKNRRATAVITLSVIAIFAVTIVGTTSRMALLLLPLMLAVSLSLLFFGQSVVRLILPSICGLLALAVVVWLGGGFAKTLVRFSSIGDSRFDYWTDVQWALGHYGLAGTGIGTFIPVHKSAESLDSVTPATLNHAHNDYIELLLEGGIPAAILIASLLALVTVAMVCRLKANEGREQMLLAAASATGLVAILLFSLVDYPLRMPAIAVLFSLFLAVLLPRRAAGQNVAQEARASGKVVRWAGIAGLAAAALVTVQAGVSARQLLADQPGYALQWAPWSTTAHSRQASRLLLVDGRPQLAERGALAALRLSPIDAPAIRTFAMVRGLAGEQAKSARLMEMSATLGWRDPITNLWAIDTARRSADTVKLVQRAEALYRQGEFLPAATDALLKPPTGQQSIELLVRDLAARPPWRRPFLRSLDRISPESLPLVEDLIVRLNRTRSPVSLDEAGPLMEHLARLGRTDERQQLWFSLHPKLIANGDFEDTSSFRGPELPQDWDISNEDLNVLSIDKPGFGGKGSALRIFGARPATPLIAQQMMLQPGHYLLTLRMRSRDGSKAAWRWEIRCLDTGQNINHDVRLPADSRWQSSALLIAVPNRNCRNQRLSLQRLGDTTLQPMWLDDIRLQRRD